MKEVVKVSIAKLAFNLENAAYDKLNRYLLELEKEYKDNPDGAEIIADIEARIVEIILSQQSVEIVVSEQLVSSIIAQLGYPEDMGPAAEATGNYVLPVETDRFPRRLYRNREGAKLGGVCSGIATYLGADPVWIRIGFFSPLLLMIIFALFSNAYFVPSFIASLFGAFVLLYFILWIATPLAKTPRQILEMNGGRITTSSIERTADKYSREETYSSASGPDKTMNAVGKILLFCVKAFVLLVGFGFAIAAIGIIIAMFSIPGLDIFGNCGPLHYFGEIPGIGSFVTMLLAAVLIPLIMLVYSIVSLVFNKRVNKAVMWILGIGWLVLVIYTGTIAIKRNYYDSYFNLEQKRYSSHKRHLKLVVPAAELENFQIR